METQSQPHAEPFSSWAVLELMGHQRMAGLVTQATFGNFLRIDVYADEETVAYTRFVNPASVYAINPCDKAMAVACGMRWAKPPIERWELAGLLPTSTSVDPVYDDEDFDDEPVF